ncbi:MAG: hypothetical protein WBA98_08250 [Gordonia sp. (in: high G+C Gram-positive bacteria)]|uniref:hypothetical protein n=1 Tax=Gordonia sp. (in: high G+C Gram-positive bacteria) TaxID=84139 RepID=UPI003C70D899
MSAHDVIAQHVTADSDPALILAALAAAGYAVVKLPEPNRTRGSEPRWVDQSSFSEPGYLRWSVGVTEGGIPFSHSRRGDGPPALAVPDHAALGAAILAAAQYAEGGGSGE